MTDDDDDAIDGVLFRFWIRAASYPGGWPGRLMQLFAEHGPKPGEGGVQPKHYRAALMALAKEKGVNLPEATDWSGELRKAGETIAALRKEGNAATANERERCAALLEARAQEFNRLRDPGMANHCRSLAARIRKGDNNA